MKFYDTWTGFLLWGITFLSGMFWREIFRWDTWDRLGTWIVTFFDAIKPHWGF